jgi:hypothetical protein
MLLADRVSALLYHSGSIPELSNPFVEQIVGVSSRLVNLPDPTGSPHLLEILVPSPVAIIAKAGFRSQFCGGKLRMHARPEVQEILIAKKLKRWAMIGQHPFVDPTCSPSRARRNFLRLPARYPDTAQRLNLTVASAYPRI